MAKNGGRSDIFILFEIGKSENRKAEKRFLEMLLPISNLLHIKIIHKSVASRMAHLKAIEPKKIMESKWPRINFNI